MDVEGAIVKLHGGGGRGHSQTSGIEVEVTGSNSSGGSVQCAPNITCTLYLMLLWGSMIGC